MIERITSDGQLLCYIVRAGLMPRATTFITPPDLNLQLGYVVYPARGEIPRHVHRRVARSIVGTAEVLIVRSGRCEMDIYGNDRRHVATREIEVGDVVIIVGGGHGFRMSDDTVLLEVKQGPYSGMDEKERF
jgi:mannose-6-phosphate isomerase-like protein (cupin superfamily)